VREHVYPFTVVCMNMRTWHSHPILGKESNSLPSYNTYFGYHRLNGKRTQRRAAVGNEVVWSVKGKNLVGLGLVRDREGVCWLERQFGQDLD